LTVYRNRTLVIPVEHALSNEKREFYGKREKRGIYEAVEIMVDRVVSVNAAEHDRRHIRNVLKAPRMIIFSSCETDIEQPSAFMDERVEPKTEIYRLKEHKPVPRRRPVGKRRPVEGYAEDRFRSQEGDPEEVEDCLRYVGAVDAPVFAQFPGIAAANRRHDVEGVR